MAYQLHTLTGGSNPSRDSLFREQIERLLLTDGPRFRRLWAYYRNPMRPCGVPVDEQGSERPYRQAQEWGLPSRITGLRSGIEVFNGSPVDGVVRKEVVVENDIGWRIDTLTDYLFGKPIVINSAAPDPHRRALIEPLLRQIIAHNGGIVFLQQLALLGEVYGYIDVLVKFENSNMENGVSKTAEHSSGSSILDPQPSNSSQCGTSDLGQPPIMQSDPSPDGGPPSRTQPAAIADAAHVSAGPEPGVVDTETAGASRSSLEALLSLACRIRLEIVEPARALPILSPTDYRCVEAYAQVYRIARPDGKTVPPAKAGSPALSLMDRLRAVFSPIQFWDRLVTIRRSSSKSSRRTNGNVMKMRRSSPQGTNSLGCVPLVHIQNTSVPFEYSGCSDVEPLIPVQDEINSRLSDRAYRITMQAFKMYLGKGIENFTQMPVAPGACG